MTQWAPDTCKCIFEVDEDWKSAKTIEACEHHSKDADPFVSVRNENVYKNMVVNEVVEALQVKSSEVFGYYDPLRGLVIQTPEGTPDSVVTSVKGTVDSIFGVDSATVL